MPDATLHFGIGGRGRSEEEQVRVSNAFNAFRGDFRDWCNKALLLLAFNEPYHRKFDELSREAIISHSSGTFSVPGYAKMKEIVAAAKTDLKALVDAEEESSNQAQKWHEENKAIAQEANDISKDANRISHVANAVAEKSQKWAWWAAGFAGLAFVWTLVVYFRDVESKAEVQRLTEQVHVLEQRADEQEKRLLAATPPPVTTAPSPISQPPP